MPTTYKFSVICPQGSMLPKDQVINTFHMQNVGGLLTDTEFDPLLDDICDLWQSHYGNVSRMVTCRVYNVGAPPQYPIAEKVKGTATWGVRCPREIAICLSYAKDRRRPRERGRMYLSPGMREGGTALDLSGARPGSDVLNWALAWYSTSNDSFPDLGGVDWKFGVYSPTNGTFSQTKEAWVDDEWDTVRSRGLQPSTRVSSVRDG